jgi:orotate phosphoribosyltransferase
LEAITKHDLIKFLTEGNILRFGTYTLKSGGKSPFFINLGDICSGKAYQFIGRAYAEHLQRYFGPVNILYGPPYKAISLSTAAAMAYEQLFNKRIYTLYSRKEEKAHGEKGVFVGKAPIGIDRIVVIDDVLTTGGTKLEAIEAVEKTFNVRVNGILVVVDRRVKNADSGLGSYAFKAMLSLPDIVSYLISIRSSHAKVMEDFYEGRYVG